jgi:hypothetical protein
MAIENFPNHLIFNFFIFMFWVKFLFKKGVLNMSKRKIIGLHIGSTCDFKILNIKKFLNVGI